MKASKLFVPRYFDIGVNLTDSMFKGVYRGRTGVHPLDIDEVIHRSRVFNVEKMLVTGSSIEESINCIELCKKYPGYLYCTVGVHPCAVTEFVDKDHKHGEDALSRLLKLKQVAISGAESGVVKSFGEIGLDYDRLHFAPKDLQKEYFKKQLDIAMQVQLPLFLHMRAACDDFIEIIEPYVAGVNGVKLPLGVVHSFTGTVDELQKLLKLGFYISVNGCSLRTQENCEVAKNIPIDKLLIETDAPWCEIRPTHYSYQFLSEYPNAFYPLPDDQKFEYEEPDCFEDPSTLKSNKKNISTGTLHKFIPFPTVKQDQYFKRYNVASRKDLGIRAPPFVKSRNEPVMIGLVAEIMCKLRGIDPEILVEACYRNSLELFKIDDDPKN